MPPKRPTRPAIEDQLRELAALRGQAPNPTNLTKLRDALVASQNLVVARAAKVIEDLGLSELAPDLVAAFDRLMAEPSKLDRGCQAMTAIAVALLALEVDAEAVFRRGLAHVQLEPAFGGPNDVAVGLRANSAVGLANCGPGDTVSLLVPLLLDPAPSVRIAAARALGASGKIEAPPVLRLKALVGDEEPEVLTECLAGLLHLEPRTAFDFVDRFLRAPAQLTRQAAILALGEARRPEAVARLLKAWPRELDRDNRRALIIALATSRQDSAFTFLLDLVGGDNGESASFAVEALAHVDVVGRPRTVGSHRDGQHRRLCLPQRDLRGPSARPERPASSPLHRCFSATFPRRSWERC